MEKEHNYRKKQFLTGIKDGIPILIGFLPIGITFAMLAHNAGFSGLETNVMSIFILAGASQMMAVNMVTAGAGIFEIVLATCILNLRHLVMSTCVMNKLKGENPVLKLISAFGVTDESFGVFSMKSEENKNIWYFFGIGGMTYFSWIVGTAIGAFVIQFIPDLILKSMGIALYAMFISLVIPDIKKSSLILKVTICSMVINCILSRFIASSWSLIVATIAGAYIGVLISPDDDTENETNNEISEKDEITKKVEADN